MGKQPSLVPVHVYVLADRPYSIAGHEELQGVINASLRCLGQVAERIEVDVVQLPSGQAFCTLDQLQEFLAKHIGAGQAVVFDGMRTIWQHLATLAMQALPFLIIERRLEGGEVHEATVVYNEDGQVLWHRPPATSPRMAANAASVGC